MAIRRCPYCKAIIDESQKYCNNCGTQLLFPEDENVEEDIKGEKIIDEDFRDEEGGDEEEPVKEEEIDLEEVMDGQAEFPDERAEEEERPDEEELAEKEPEEPEAREIAPPLELEKSNIGGIAPGPEAITSGEEEVEARPRKPDAEIEAEGRAELSENREAQEPADTSAREEIARLVAAMDKKQRRVELTEEEVKIVERLEDSADLPPWANSARETAASGDLEENEGGKEEEKIVGAGDTVDFEEEVMTRAEKMTAERKTIGIPERLTRTPGEVAGEREDVVAKDAAIEIPKDEERTEEPNVEESEIRLGFFGRLKATVFDLVFIVLVWLGTVWLASRLMDVPLPGLVAASAAPLAIFFLVLFFGYLFLFLFFLGETLGGRLVSPRN